MCPKSNDPLLCKSEKLKDILLKAPFIVYSDFNAIKISGILVLGMSTSLCCNGYQFVLSSKC